MSEPNFGATVTAEGTHFVLCTEDQAFGSAASGGAPQPPERSAERLRFRRPGAVVLR